MGRFILQGQLREALYGRSPLQSHLMNALREQGSMCHIGAFHQHGRTCHRAAVNVQDTHTEKKKEKKKMENGMLVTPQNMKVNVVFTLL